MNGKSIATFLAVICGAGLGYLGSCVVRPEAKARPPEAAPHDATLSHEHQALLDMVIRERSPESRAALQAGREGNGSSPRQGG